MIRIQAERIIFAGTGIDLLRSKLRVAQLVGTNNVKLEPGVGFSVDKSFIHCLHELIKESQASTDVQELVLQGERFKTAIKTAKLTLHNPQGQIVERWKGILDLHQQSAVEALALPDLIGACLFDEQGSGKTVMAIAVFDCLKVENIIDKVIVLCPKTMIGEWRKDVAKLCGERYGVAASTDSVGRVPKGFEEWDIYLANFESLSTIGMRLEMSAERHRTLLIVDESFFVKNPGAERTLRARKLRGKCVRGIVLCGTPAPNSYRDVIAQVNLADDGFAFSGFTDNGLQSVEHCLEERAFLIRRQKIETMPSLARKVVKTVSVMMEPEQRRLYDEARTNLVLHLRTLDNNYVLKPTDGFFQKYHALLQLCSWPQSVDPTYMHEPGKLSALDSLLEQLIQKESQKVVLWSAYIDPISALVKRYRSYSPVFITGDVPVEKRAENVSAFQNAPSTKLFIANPSAAGMGITLTAAANAVFLSFSNRAADYLQAVDRIHRRGQTAAEVRIFVLMCTDSIEQRLFKRLLSKEETQSILLKDRDRGLTVEEAIWEIQGDG